MCNHRYALIWVQALASVVIAIAPAAAQEDPNNARFKKGTVAVSPVVRLTNVGWDSNVFNDSPGNNPKSDAMATFTPTVEGWLRTPRVRVNGRAQLDMFYYRELTALRAVDNDHSGRVEVVLNRITPWVAGNVAITRHRQNFEIDAIAKQRSDGVRVGTDVRLTRKTSVQLSGGRSRFEYLDNSVFRGTDLARALNHSGSSEGLSLRYEVTPLTTFAVDAGWGRDRFGASPERNSDSFGIGPSVEFKPFALISGRAAVGFRRVTLLQPGQPEFNGTTASVDLQYTVRTRTQIGVGLQRNLEYSYLASQRDYILTSLGTSVTQRVTDRWDLRGTVGRTRLGYRRIDRTAASPELFREAILSYGIGVGYNMGRNRVAIDVQHLNRDSNVADGRNYRRLRVGSSLTYIF